MKVLIAGGAARDNKSFGRSLGDFSHGVLMLLDLESGEIIRKLDYKTHVENRPSDTSSDLFKTPHLAGDFIYVPTKTEVLKIQVSDFAIVKTYSHPFMNDVHHALLRGNELFVVSTGIDSVLVLDEEKGDLIRTHQLVTRFDLEHSDRERDFRKEESLKPHELHPNYAFEHDGDIWVTCLSDGSVRNLTSTASYKISDRAIHDGVQLGGEYFFTSVNGTVIRTDLRGERRVCDLNEIETKSTPLGWCRGILPFDDGTALVGFSVLRRTKFVENVRWASASIGLDRSFTRLPTRMVHYDLENLRALASYDIQNIGLAAVFGILTLEVRQ